MRQSFSVIILATNYSSVFPERSFLRIGGETILKNIVRRINKSNHATKALLCISNQKFDDSLAVYGEKIGLPVVRGVFEDVILRLLEAYKSLATDIALIVRGDTPFIDPEQLDRLIDLQLLTGADLCYSEHLSGLPYGIGGQIMTSSVLKSIHSWNVMGHAIQNIFSMAKLNESKFSTAKLTFDTPNPDARFVVENRLDYDFACEIHKLSGADANVNELLKTLSENPHLLELTKQSLEINEIGTDKLFLSTEKTLALSTGKFDPSYPISVELSLTNSCNFACKWCSDQKLRTRHPGLLSFEVFDKLCSDLKSNGTNGLVIEGGGEPTVHPQFRDFVISASKHGLALGLITNGFLLDYLDLLPNFEWIRISLDADSQETFRRAKGKDGFHIVLDNIRKLCDAKKNTVIGVGYVVCNENISNLEGLTLLLSDYGADYLQLRPVIDHPELKIKVNLYHLKKYESPMKIILNAMEDNLIKGNGGLPCLASPLSSVISADGSVFLCGRLNIHDWLPTLGNINEQSFHDIWLGDERKRQLAMVANPVFCSKNCPECRLTKFNFVLNRISKIKTRNFI